VNRTHLYYSVNINKIVGILQETSFHFLLRGEIFARLSTIVASSTFIFFVFVFDSITILSDSSVCISFCLTYEYFIDRESFVILKEKIIIQKLNPMANAGQEQEKNVSFYLRRAFKNDPQVFVFNDIKLTYDDEQAQIDHLIVYPYGFILIESKSITGVVSVNERGEWSRSYQNQWRGIPSPIKQVELQRDILKKLISAHVERLLDKLFGINVLQKGVGMRCWDSFCAISSNAIIDREKAPPLIAEQLVKSEFIADAVKAKMNLSESKPTALQLLKNDSRPWFNESELKRICDFLLDRDISSKSKSTESLDNGKENITVQSKEQSTAITLQCKKCGEASKLLPAWGKYGYYVKCSQCSTNTSMKRNCPSCQNKVTKISKSKATYTLKCEECSTSHTVFTDLTITN
jgi:hypothetical protein